MQAPMFSSSSRAGIRTETILPRLMRGGRELSRSHRTFEAESRRKYRVPRMKSDRQRAPEKCGNGEHYELLLCIENRCIDSLCLR